MKRKYFYLSTLIIVFALPSVVAGYYVLKNISLAHLISFVVLITLIGSIWDIWATKHGPNDPVWLWQFNHKETIGVYIFGLPIEEYLFYVASSVYVVFIWESIRIALETDNPFFYFLIPALGVWTLTGIMIPYVWKPKGDKLIG